MKNIKGAKHIISALIIFLLALTPATAARLANAGLSNSTATQIQQDESDLEGVTFDNLLAVGSYSLYIEARNIGQLSQSAEVASLIDPLKPMLAGMQNEFTTIGEFVVANADALSRSRMMMAMQPSKSSLPAYLMAVELGSADAAEKFEQKIKEFITATMKSAIGVSASIPFDNNVAGSASGSAAKQGANQAVPIKRVGRLIAASFTPFTFKGLRPQSEKSLSDDPNFRAARDRFYSETFFIYYDIALSDRVTKERKDSQQRPAPPPPKAARPGTPLSVNEPAFSIEPQSPALQPLHSYSADSDSEVSGPSATDYSAQYASDDSEPSYEPVAQGKSRPTSKPAQSSKKKASAIPSPSPKTQTPPDKRANEQPSSPQPSQQPAIAPPREYTPVTGDPVQGSQQGSSNQLEGLLSMVMRGGFGSGTFPDAVGIGLTLESDSLIVRLLMINAPGAKMGPIPFMPLQISGPPQPSDAAAYMPSDTDVFITASVDLNQLYELGSSMMNARGKPESPQEAKDKDSSEQSGLTAIEKKFGFNVKEDLLSTLGGEVAIGLPARYLSSTPLGGVPLNPQTSQGGLVFLISVRNREALQAKLKPILEAVGLKAPNEKGISQKHGDIEINSYSYGSVAFINNYLVIGSTAGTVRHVLEARAKQQTLMASRDFHSYMQWQPRDTVAQLYISAAVLKDAFKQSQAVIDRYDAETKQFLAQFDYTPEPITYAATSDAAGPLYELRIPRNLVARAFAEISVTQKMIRGPMNESMAKSFLHQLNAEQSRYKMQHGRFGTLDEVTKTQGGEKGFRSMFDSLGYKLEFTLSGDRYTATATPIEYGKNVKISFYTDNTGVMREADHGGKPATASDKPVSMPPNQ